MSKIIILGGGVIGVCAAYYLAQQGAQVTLIEKGEIAAGCSYGNAGWVVPSHSIPLATPDAVKNGLKWMFDPVSPFYIKPRLDLDLLRWLLKFAQAANRTQISKAIPILRDLNMASRYLFDGLSTQAGMSFDYHQQGILMLFRTVAGFEGGTHEVHELHAFDQRAYVLSQAQTRQMEPMVHPDVVGSVHFPDDAHLDPAIFVRQMAEQARLLGADVKTHITVTGLNIEAGKVIGVETSVGPIRAEQLVVALGSWSPQLVQQLQINIPVQAGKGYSITVKRPQRCPGIPLGFAEARVVTSTLSHTLRLAGTMELSGIDLGINQARLQAILAAPKRYLQDLGPLEIIEAWAGLRPCAPDGLPIIGRTKKHSNVILATGHAMMGLSLGPITGKLIAQIAGNSMPEIDISMLSPDRF